MFRIIPTSYTGIKTTFGKFSKLCLPGINFYIPYIQSIVPISNKLKNKDFLLDVRTKDNVFVQLDLAVQYKIHHRNSANAYYSMENPENQIEAYVENTVRSTVPSLDLEELFSSQEHISGSVLTNLKQKMDECGYTIENILVTDIIPDKKVIDSMNKIKISERLKEAAKNDADSYYIESVRKAEADSERKRLQGEGISKQRLAILNGYEQSITKLSSKLGIQNRDLIEFVVQTQYMDTIEAIGKSNNTKTIFVNPEKVGEFLRTKES